MTRGGHGIKRRRLSSEAFFISRQTHFWLKRVLLEETFFYHLCGGRQDNKVVGTDIQMGSFVRVNKERSLPDRPILTFLACFSST